MRTEYSLDIVGKCPMNGCADVYRLVLRASRCIMAETIIMAVAIATAKPATQEDITLDLSARLDCRAETEGVHSGVLTRVVCGDEG